MIIQRRRWLWLGLSFVLLVVSLGWVGSVRCQEKYPSRDVDIICTFGAGGANDLISRIIADYMKKKWGVPVNVVNKPGGATLPATLDVYKARPDGYTILADGNSSSSMLAAAVKDLPIEVMDRTFIATTTSFPMTVVVPSGSPFKSLKDIEAEVKRAPQTFTWTSMSRTGAQDYVARQFFKKIGVDVLKTKPVNAKSGREAATLAAGGHVMLGIVAPSSGLAAIKGGLIRPLAVTGERRFSGFPEVPTTAELGYPTISYLQWTALSGPPKLPSSIVEVWDKAVQEMLKDPEIVARLEKLGVTPFYKSASATREHVRKEMEEVKDLWGLK